MLMQKTHGTIEISFNEQREKTINVLFYIKDTFR